MSQWNCKCPHNCGNSINYNENKIFNKAEFDGILKKELQLLKSEFIDLERLENLEVKLDELEGDFIDFKTEGASEVAKQRLIAEGVIYNWLEPDYYKFNDWVDNRLKKLGIFPENAEVVNTLKEIYMLLSSNKKKIDIVEDELKEEIQEIKENL